MNIWRVAILPPLLLTLLVSVPLTTPFADTSFKAGDGENLVFGHSVLTANIPKKPGGETENLPCLLLGTVRGKPVVIPIDKKPAADDPRYNQLYMVEIIDSKTARYSDIVMNSIPVDMHGANASDSTQPISQLLWSGFDPAYHFGHPIGRILELPEQISKDESVLLFTHGQGDLYQLSLTEQPNPIPELRTLKAEQVRKWTSSSFNYINLDLIDLNGFVRPPEQGQSLDPIPYSVAVWYQRLGPPTRNFWAQANSLALAQFKVSDGLKIYQSLEGVDPFKNMRTDGPDFWHLKTREDYFQYPVVGGAFINPDRNGTIRYWFSGDDLMYTKNPYGNVDQDRYVRTWSAELQYDPSERRIKLNEQLKNTNTLHWITRSKKNWSTANTIFERYVRNWTGPFMRMEADKISVKIDNETEVDSSYWKSRDYVAGEESKVEGQLLNIVTPAETGIGISEYDNIPDDKLTPLKLNERSLRNANISVVTVIYGWPYFIEAASPSTDNTPSFSRKEGSQTIKWTKGSYGGGFEAEIGGSGKLFAGSAIGGFNWESGTEKTSVDAQAVTVSANFGGAKDFADFSKWGVVIYNETNPRVESSANFAALEPSTYEFKLKGLGDDHIFMFHVTSFALSNEINMNTSQFDVTNPDFASDGRSASALSDGLAPRWPSTTIKVDTEKADRDRWVEKIVEWEKSVKLDQFIDLSLNPRQTGVSPVQAMLYNLKTTKDYNFSKIESDKSTSDQTWYGGAHFQIKAPKTGGFFGDLKLKHTGSYSTSDTNQSERAYTIKVNGISDSILGAVYFKIHVLDIDIAKLKSYVARNPEAFHDKDGNPDKPALIPNWNWKYHQDFTLVVTQYYRTESLHSRTIAVHTKDGRRTDVTLIAEGVSRVRLKQVHAPVGRPNHLYLPLKALKVEAWGDPRGAGRTFGRFVIYVDADFPVNGFWVRDRRGRWVDIATTIVREGDRTRIEFSIVDGGPYDVDRAKNRHITYVGGPGWRASTAAGNERGFDLNGDGFADLVLYDELENRVQVILTKGLELERRGSVEPLGQGWQIDGFGRFEKGTAMMVSHPDRPDRHLRFVAGTHLADDVFVARIPRWWGISFLADLDDDGNSDAILRNRQTNALEAVYLDGRGHPAGLKTIGSLSKGQVVRFPADLTGDGRAESVLENPEKGSIQALSLDSGQPEVADILTLPYGWTLVTRGFFNTDEHADLMVWDTVLGELWLLAMEGTEVKEKAWFDRADPGIWTFVQVADANGDGLSDIIWLNELDQTLHVTLMAPMHAGATRRLLELPPGWSVAVQ